MKAGFRLLRLLLPPDNRAAVQGCLEEMAETVAAEKGPFRARLWLWGQIVRSIPGFLSHMLSWQATLLHTHFLVTSRQIVRHLGLFFIKIFGLAAGIGCALVIILFVANELTYDRFHPDSERVFRITTRRVNNIGEYRFSSTPGPLAPSLRKDWPQAEAVARIISPLENANSVLTVSGEKRFFERRAWFVDPEIFDVLSVPFTAGDPKTALTESHAVVITESAARKYFGEGSALGRTLQLELDYDMGSTNLEDFRVSGIVRDAPANTHWKYDLLISMATLAGKIPTLDTDWAEWHSKFTYLKLAPGADRPALEKQLAAYAARARESDKTTTLLEYPLQPVRSIHLAPATTLEMEPPGNRYYLFIYALVAGLVLLIGIMNYVNLSASLSTLRVREVGIRKVAGSRRRDLIYQFLCESALVTLLAFLLALLLATYLLNFFNSMAGTALSLAGLLKPEVLIPLILLLATVMLAAGAYPALILSSFRPSEMLSGRNRSGGRGGAAVQRLLVLGQFAVSIFLVVCTLVVFRQLHFMKGRSLGFERADKIVLEVKSDLPAFQRNYASITEALRGNPAVTGAAVSSVIPGVASQGGYYLKRGESYASAEKPIRMKTIAVDPDYMDLYGIRAVAGRKFGADTPGDRTGSFVVNETGARALGFSSPQEALGARFTAHYNRRTKAIVGVVKDFHFMGMKDSADPILFDLEPSLLRYITLSAAPGRAREAAAFAERVWRERFPGVPFEYELLDETFGRVYGYEEQMGSLLGVVTGLGLTAAFLGLLGLVSFYSRQRRKEIAIRKTIGAPNAHILALLSRRFVGLISMAGLLAVPSAWWSANAWLRGFAYRIKPGAPVFLFSLGVSVLIALAAILFQGMKASRSRPADVLRHE